MVRPAPPGRPPREPPVRPPDVDPVVPDPPGKQRAQDQMRLFVAKARKDGKRRPNRNAIEAHIRNAEKFSRDELNAHLLELYDEGVALGVLRAR